MLSTLKKIWVIIYRINFDPQTEWELLKSESSSVSYHMKKIVMPVTLCISIATFTGYFFASGIYGYTFVYVCIRTISAFCESFFPLYIAFLIIYEISPGMGLTAGRDNLFKLMTYSFSSFWLTSFIAGLLANYKTLDEFLKYLGLFGMYLFWTGAESLLTFENGRKIRFVLVSFGIILIIYSLIHWSFGYALTIAHFPEIFN